MRKVRDAAALPGRGSQMAGGFGTVPEELQRASATIGDIIGRVAGLAWREPSGDYGHAGLQSAYAGFISGMRGRVSTLAEAADGHAGGLHDAAAAYQASDEQAGAELGRAVGAIGPAGAAAGIGGGGGIGGAAVASSPLARRLNPGTAPPPQGAAGDPGGSAR